MQKQEQISYYEPKKQLLSCKLCTDIFKKPITLTCGHTFCYICLYKFMKQHYAQSPSSQSQQKLFLRQKKDDIPIPLCPSCCSLIFKPIKFYKQNLTISNLISKANYKPQIQFTKHLYDQEIENFNHKILITIEDQKTDLLPHTYTEIRFKTSFLDDIMEQSHTTHVVVQWQGFNQNVGLAGKIIRSEVEYHSSNRGKQNHYRALFHGLHFVTIQKRKILQINLKSRYYNESSLYYNQQSSSMLQICKCVVLHSINRLPLQRFNYFLSFYDTLSNPHYLNQIYRIIQPQPFLQRYNSQAMIYCCMRLLRMDQKTKKQIVRSFDDQQRITKVNQFLQMMGDRPVEDFMYITIPGKYNSFVVFAVIFVLILLHYVQNN